jgi:hypothetical protein
MTIFKRKWLELENWAILNRGLLAIAAWLLFFAVFPFFVKDAIDFDAISAHLR